MRKNVFVLDFYTRHSQGFGHSIMSFCRAIEFARSNGMTFAIDDSRWFMGRWSDYFGSKFPSPEQYEEDQIYRKHIGQKQFDESEYARFKRLDVEIKHMEKYNYFLDPGILSILKEIYRYNDKFGEFVEKECDLIRSSFENVVALHIRLGDKIPQHKMDLKDHLRVFKKLIEDHRLQQCDIFLMTDDHSIDQAVCDELEKPILIRKPASVGSKMLRFQKGHLGDLLIDIEIAMRSKMFFSSVSDTSRLVRAYRAIHHKESAIEHLPI